MTRVAKARQEEQRRHFMQNIVPFHPDMLVYIDETGIDKRRAERRTGWV